MYRKSFSLLILALLLTSLLNAVTLTRSISNEDQLKDDVERKSSMEHGVGETFEGSDTGLEESRDPRKDPNIAGETHEDTRARAPGQRSDQPYADVNTQDSKIRLVVGFRSESEDALKELKETATRHRGEVVNTITMGKEVRAAAVELSWTSATAFMEETWLAEWTSYVEPAMKFEAQMVPNDPYWSLQWGPQKIEADWAWNVTVGDPSVLVAVVDSGVDYTHEDLALNYMPGGYDWVNMDNDPMDDFGHGTHCAGIIAAELDNLVGIAGLAQVRVIAEKVLNSYGGGYEDWVANGIINATDIGADIISMSLGGYGDSVLVHDAVKYASDAGVLVIAAAGNDDTNMKLYPAGYDEVIAVAATDQIDNKAYFSNWGEWIELAAPGVDIYSTIPGGYASKGGTSMACPHVAGLAALVWSRHPNKTRDWVRLWMRYTADDLGETGHDIIYGYGRINARKAVAESPPAHELIAVDWTTPPYVEPGSSGSVNVTILNFGESNETNITVELLANSTPVDSLVIGFLASGNAATANLLWSPSADGLYNLTLSVEPVPGESNLENNILWKFVYVGFPVKTVVLHSAGNLYSDIISTWQALNSEWHLFGDTMVYIDYVSLNIEDITYEDINETDADVLIISCASDPYSGWEFTDSEVEAIEQYVHEGHGLIATAGTFYYYVPNNNKLAPLFGLCDTEYWGVAYTDLLHIEDALHPILFDVPDPFVFPQVGGALPEDGEWSSDELVGGEYIARGHYRESAIVTYRGLVYISPWLEIQPPYYHHHMQLLYNALTWSSYKKPDHELIAGLEAPKFLEPGESALLNATVYNRGLNNETDVELFLFIDGAVVNATIISTLLTDASHTISYWWTPTVEAAYNVTAYALPVPDEEYISNNVKSVTIPVTHIAVALFKNIDPWDDPSNEEALSLYNIPYIVFSSSDIGSVDLNAFSKVVIASDQDQDFYDAMYIYRWWFEDYVSMGGVLEIHAADWGWHGGGWIAPLPGGLQWVSYSANYVTLVDPTHPVATTPNMITDSELDGWGASVHGYFNTYPTDSRIVIVEDSTGMPAYLEFGYGAGFVVASSQTLEWAYIREYSRILENSLLYIPTRPEHDLAVVLDAPNFLEPGDSSLLNATVYNRGLSNETDVELFLFIDEAEVESVVIPELLNGSSYTLSHQWTPTLEGTYNITAYAPPVPDEEYPANNKWTKIIDVRPIRGLILFDQTHWTDNIENYETWVENLTDYGYIVETHISGPITLDTLEDYCAFVIPQAQDYYQPAELTAIQDYVLLGGGLIVIGDDAPSIYTELTSFAGITWTSGGYSGYTSDITPHPITEDVNTAYFDSPVSEMQVASPAVDLIRDNQGGIMLAASEISAGKVIGIADEHSIRDGYIYSADNLRLARNMIEWTCVPPLEHELTVNLEAPPFLTPGDSSLLRATVQNSGLSNETNVDLLMFIDGATVNSTTISELPTGESYTISYLWTPTVEATYNVTAYAPPVPGEDVTANNVVMKDVLVSSITGTYISVTPTMTSVSIGESFTVSVDIVNVTSLYGFDVLLNWDPAMLEYESHETTVPVEDHPGGVLHEPVFVVKDEANQTQAACWVVYSSMAPAPSFSGSGTVFKITLRTLKVGTTPLEISSSDLASDTIPPESIPHYVINGVVQVTESTPALHDVAILNVTTSRNATYPGHAVNITVTAANMGNSLEDFNVTVYYGNTPIETQSIAHLPPAPNPHQPPTPNSIEILTFTWNTAGLEPCNNHTIWAEVHPVPHEANTTNNIYHDGVVKIKLLGDLDGNDVVDILDVVTAAHAYRARRGEPRWNQEADLAPIYGVIDIYDIVTIVYIFSSCP